MLLPASRIPVATFAVVTASLGGANSWPGMALDERTGIVYVPTGSAASTSTEPIVLATTCSPTR